MERSINDLLAYHDLAPEQPFLLETVVIREPKPEWPPRARVSVDLRCGCQACRSK